MYDKEFLMNRSERRRMEQTQKRAIKKMAKEAAKSGWGEWIECLSDIPKASLPEGIVVAWKNNVFTVQMYLYEDAAVSGVFTVFGIRRHDKSPTISWDDLMRIKNEIAGVDRWAMEMYPPQDQLVDVANMRWLWCGPKGSGMPIGMHCRKIVADDTGRIIHETEIVIPDHE